MLDAGVIRPSSSEFASPVCLVRKKSEGVRVCTDFRALNDITVKDSFPLPRINECLDALAGNVWFSSFDLTSAYYQVEIAPEDIHKTAFITKWGLFEYTKLAFGLTNSPATFSRVIQIVLRDLLLSKAIGYLDDINSLGKDFEEAFDNVRLVLERIHKYNLKLKPEKM